MKVQIANKEANLFLTLQFEVFEAKFNIFSHRSLWVEPYFIGTDNKNADKIEIRKSEKQITWIIK
jgi:hypothetical protein